MEDCITYLYYDQSSPSGLRWKVARSNRVKKDSIAGSKDKDGYYQVKVCGKVYKAHRVVWFLHHGAIPDGLEIDHKDRKRDNNKIDNLQVKSHRGNCLNTSRSNKYPGVQPSGQRFKQEIRIEGKLTYLGSFDTEELAYQAYCLKLQEIEFGTKVPRGEINNGQKVD